ncbi:hypothetical protein Emed_004773 [Eimeria media]
MAARVSTHLLLFERPSEDSDSLKEQRKRMSHAPRPCDFATLLSQQRFLRQQEQQVRSELLRLSRGQPSTLSEDRPLPPPPPQKPIQRRSLVRGPYYLNDYSVADGFTRRPSAERGLRGPGPEARQFRSMSAAVAQRKREVQQEQLERRRKLMHQQQPEPPAPLFGEAALARLHSHPYEISPYSFDLIEAPGKLEKVRSVTSPMLDAYAISNEAGGRRHRQQDRVSPRSLPAAGMPSGHKRAGEEWTEKRQRRQVVPLHDADSPLHTAAGGSQWPVARDQRSSRRPQSMSRAPSGILSGSMGNRRQQALPSTAPPALHPEADFPAAFYHHHRRYDEHAGRGVSPGGPRVQYADEWPGGFYADQQLQKPLGRQPHADAAQQCFVEQVAAGMPSSKITRDAYDFRQSLRAENEPKGSNIKSTGVSGHSKVRNIANHFVSTQADPRLVLSDDEETLRELGLNLSPRELLFFRKQPSLRRKQLMATRPQRGERPEEIDGATGSAVPAGKSAIARHEGDRLNLRKGELRSMPLTSALSLPSWMRAYGLPSTPPHWQSRTGAAQQRHLSAMGAAGFHREGASSPMLEDEAHAALVKLEGRGAPRCGCRCCRLRESGLIGMNAAGQQPCCCCPCCNTWDMRAGERPSPASDSPVNQREDIGAPSGAASSAVTAKSKCLRCGRWSEGKSSAGSPVGPTKQSPKSSTSPVLCDACATYLDCERRRSAGMGAGVGGSPPQDEGDKSRVAANSAEATKHTSDPRKHPPVPCKVNDKQQHKVIEPEAGLKALARKPRRPSHSVSASTPPQVHTVNENDQGSPKANSSACAQLTSGDPAREEATSLSVWESPRIVAKVCLFLPLSKLLLVRRCNKTFLQAAQFRMRFILYKSLNVLLNQSEGSLESRSVVVEGHHCPISADALIKLLGLEPDEVEAVKSGDLPPAYPDEALTPRMQDVVAAIIREREARKVVRSKEARAAQPSKPQTRRSIQQASPPSERASPASEPPSRFDDTAAQEAIKAKQQRLLLDQQMEARQAEEEARLQKMLDAEQELEQRAAVGYDEAAGPVAPPSSLPLRELSTTGYREPATFRRVRHSFLKLWNYDDEAFRQALVRATTSPFPTWMFDAAALLLRATFQVCCNSLSAPPLKDLIPLFVPRSSRQPGVVAEMPSRADSYLWAKMARISGYAMHLVIDQTWPPRREAAVRLVARPLIDSAALTSGGGVDDMLLQQAAVEGGSTTSLVLRPTVVDSLELKMSRLNPEFIAEFISYGKQQQLLHSGDPQFLLKGEARQYKGSRELVLLMDLYEWLAAVLTHNQRSGLCPSRQRMPSTRAAAAHTFARGQSTRAGRRKDG